MGAISELDAIIEQSLRSFYQDICSDWGGRENEMVNLYAHGHLAKHVKPNTILSDLSQSGVEVAVQQLPKASPKAVSLTRTKAGQLGTPKRSTRAGTPRAWANSITGTISGSREGTRPTEAKAGGGIVDSHVLQNVRRRLKRRLAHLVHADRVPAVFTSHKSTACNVSGRGVHASRLRFIGERCGGIGTPP
jgi:hypothetical protein